MDFPVQKRRHRSEHQYRKDSVDLAYLFAKEVHKECKDLIKAIVLFGSTARKKQGAQDIDILVVLDDTTLELTAELIQSYRVILTRIIGNISNRLHVTTLKFTAFWEYARIGDPIAINILRDGFPLLDTGFFDPLQLLLHQGRIKPTSESMLVYQERAESSYQNSAWHIFQAVLDLYWVVVDISHAALMKLGEVPPSPEHVADLLEEKLVKKKLVSKKVPQMMRKIYRLSKDITHRKKQELKGAEYDALLIEVDRFLKEMKAFIER